MVITVLQVIYTHIKHFPSISVYLVDEQHTTIHATHAHVLQSTKASLTLDIASSQWVLVQFENR